MLSEELLSIALGLVEEIKMMASNAMCHEAITASVRACSEEAAAILDMKAGTLMSMAASVFVVANEESIQGQTSGVIEETVRQQRVANTSQLQAQQVESEAEQLNESWEEAIARLSQREQHYPEVSEEACKNSDPHNLITATVQHCESQESIKESESTGAERIRFVAAVSP